MSIQFTRYDVLKKADKKPRRSDDGAPWQLDDTTQELPEKKENGVKYRPRYNRTRTKGKS